MTKLRPILGRLEQPVGRCRPEKRMNFDDMTPLQRRLHNAAIVLEAEGNEHGFSVLLRETIEAMAESSTIEFLCRKDADFYQDQLWKLREEIEPLRAALNEAIGLRVSLWRNGDFEGDDDKLTDEQVAKKDPYAKKWIATLPPNAEVKGG